MDFNTNQNTNIVLPNSHVQYIPNILVISSLFFATNMLTALYKKYYAYAALFAILTFTSLNYHSQYSTSNRRIDQTIVFFVVLYGLYVMLHKPSIMNSRVIFVIMASLLLMVYVYFYGHLVNRFCGDPDTNIGNKYHFLLHLVSSVVCHTIVLLD
jgi:uncharacterized membrane protein YccC